MSNLFTRIVMVVAFITVGFGANAQSISSNLNARPGVVVDAEEDFETVYSGITASTVKLKITLANAAQAANIDLSLFAMGNYSPLVFDANGISESPAVPPAFFASPLLLKVTFTAAGVYNYSIAILDGTTSAVIATSSESVTVALPAPPTIASNLGTFAYTNVQTNFAISITPGGYTGTNVNVLFTVGDLAQIPNYEIEYFEMSNNSWNPLSINASGQLTLGAPGGFPLTDTSTLFRVTYDTPGTYGYKLALYNSANNDTLATAVESVTVANPAMPTISSDLNGDTILVNTLTPYNVITVANSFGGAAVKIFFKAASLAQVPNYDIEYFETSNSSWIPLALNANGEADFGPPAGFTLLNDSTQFRVTFDSVGTYAYKYSLYAVNTGDTLATSTESVTVIAALDNSGIADNASFISSTFPNPTEGIVNIQTTETGAGTLGVYTLTGKKVINRNINGPVNTVSLETLPAGMYIIKISQNEKDAVIRVVKK